MPSLVKVDKRLIDLPVFLRQRNFMACDVIGHLEMTAGAFKFLEMAGYVFGRDKFVSEDRAQKFSAQRECGVSY